MTADNFNVPILFLIFNRPDTTQIVFNEIRKAHPAQLFIAADGPRNDRPDDIENCKKTREIIQQVDWDCIVSTRFLDENLGCKRAVSSAIDWFFSHVEEGIILEDDCVPDQSFFPFCQELLERYRNDKRVMMISGINYLFNRVEMDETYFFSRYYSIWGWATWKRAWSLYDLKMSNWPVYNSHKYLDEIYQDKRIVSFFQKIMQETFSNHLDTWDIQWVYTCIFNYGLAICPKYNLVSNIGDIGVHTLQPDIFHNMPIKKIDSTEMIHPDYISPRYDLDTISFNELLKDKTFIKKMIGLADYSKRILLKRQ